MGSTRRRLLTGTAAALAALAASPRPASAFWQPGGLNGAAVQQLCADGANPGVLYAIARPGAMGSRTGLVKSLDSGRSWFGLERDLPAGFQPSAFALSPNDGRVALAGGVEGIYRSTTAGATWSRVTAQLPPVSAFLFDQRQPRTVLAGTELSGNFRSVDGGATWRPASRGLARDRYGVTLGAVLIAQHPTSAGTYLMAANEPGGVYRSRDAGLTWEGAWAGLPKSPILGLTFAGKDSIAAFALTERGVFRSADGTDWTTVSGVSGADLAALHVDPGARDIIYVAAARGALYRSTNAGASWVDLPVLPRPVRALTSWAEAQQRTLGAAAGEGVWQMALRPTLPASPEPAARNRAYYTETGHNISPTFLPFFLARGALDRFGLPRTEEMTEGDGLVQYFQKARLEYRPEQRGTAYEVQISLLGEQLAGSGQSTRIEPFESSADQRYFDETGHSASYAFLRHFNARGGMDSFGYPVTEEIQEGGRPVQYFQRARLEYRADLAGRPDEVAPGAIGDEILRQRGWLDR